MAVAELRADVKRLCACQGALDTQDVERISQYAEISKRLCIDKGNRLLLRNPRGPAIWSYQNDGWSSIVRQEVRESSMEECFFTF